jgi:heterodisulfide reductase subunit C
MNWTLRNSSNVFEKELAEELEAPLSRCRQCGLCTAICPVAKWAKTTPNALISLVAAGEQERSIRADINWLCTSCDSCTSICPEGISIKDLANLLKRVSFSHGYADEAVGPVEMIPMFYQSFWSNITGRGKLWPLSLAANFKLKSFDFFSDTLDGISMKSKGMFNFLPPSKSPERVKLLKKLTEFEQEKLKAELEEAQITGQPAQTEEAQITGEPAQTEEAQITGEPAPTEEAVEKKDEMP